MQVTQEFSLSPLPYSATTRDRHVVLRHRFRV